MDSNRPDRAQTEPVPESREPDGDAGWSIEREQRRSRQLKALADAALRVTASLTLDAVLQTITDQARLVIGAHQATTSLTIGQNWGQSITALSLSEKYAAWRTYAEHTDGSGIYALVCRDNRPMRLTQAALEAHPAWRGFGKAADRHPPMRGWLAVPLIDSDGRNLGLIQLSDKEHGEFSDDDEAILIQLAQLASVAITNARLHEALQRELTEREATEAALQESEARFRSYFQNASDVLIVLDESGRIRYTSPSVRRVLGYGVDQNVGRSAFDFVHPEDRERIAAAFRSVVARAGPFEPIEFQLLHADGRWRRFEATATNLLDDPHVRGVVEDLHDITERHRTEEIQRFLAELSVQLTETLDYQTPLDVVMRMTVPDFADCCIVDLIRDDGSPHRAAAACVDPEGEAMLLNEYYRWIPVLDERHPVARVLRTGESLFCQTVRETDLQADEPSAEYLTARRSLGLRSAIVVPLTAHGRTFGAVGFAQAGSARGFTESDLPLAEEVARRLASALENARLHQDLSLHRTQLQELVGRLLTAQEEERRRVAYDVHDGLAQIAAATHQRLQAYAAHQAPRRGDARQELEQVLALARQTVQEARRVIAGLRPTALDDFGLATAVKLETAALRGEGWDVTYEDNLHGRRLPSLIETALYRVAQESLANVRKHAGVTRVRVALTASGQTARLDVRDWGRGFVRSARSARAAGEQVGIAGMRERVKLLGGEFFLHSRPGRGTVIVAIVPLAAPATASAHLSG